MLIDEPAVQANDYDPILMAIATANGRSNRSRRLQQGIYEIGSFGGSHFLRDYEQYPELGEHGSYGVCDGAENLLEVIKELQDPQRRFVVTLTRVERDLENKGKGGGWRWHKWGEYIGKHEPTTEYLDDEPVIDHVYCYHVYEAP